MSDSPILIEQWLDEAGAERRREGRSTTAAALLRRGPVTTGTLVGLEFKLEIQCRGCARTIVVEAYELRRMFPMATPLQEAGRRLRCKKCGAHNPQMWVWIMGWTREKRRSRWVAS
jgi:hypothetical protein